MSELGTVVLERIWREEHPWGWSVFGFYKWGGGRREVAGPFETEEAAKAWQDGWQQGRLNNIKSPSRGVGLGTSVYLASTRGGEGMISDDRLVERVKKAKKLEGELKRQVVYLLTVLRRLRVRHE